MSQSMGSAATVMSGPDPRDVDDGATRGAAPLPFVSVVVPVYDRPALLACCLHALAAQRYPAARFEVIVVDDGSTDGTPRVVAGRIAAWPGARLRLVRQPHGGPASARNTGLRAARGDLIAFLDADCVAAPEWLDGLVAALADGMAAGAGGEIVNPACGGAIARYASATRFYRHRARAGRVSYLITPSVAFRRDALLAVGGFAEVAGAWAEDADLSFRLTQAGYRLVLAPHSRVTHYGAPGSVAAFARELYRYGRGNALLWRRWRNGRTPWRELARHAAAMALAPALALRRAPHAGIARALSFYPLIVLEHAAFCCGLLDGIVRG